MAAIAQNEGKFNNGTTLSSIFHVLNYNSANFQKCYIKTYTPNKNFKFSLVYWRQKWILENLGVDEMFFALQTLPLILQRCMMA